MSGAATRAPTLLGWLAAGAAALAMGLPYRLGIVVAIAVALAGSVWAGRWLEPQAEHGRG